jgi:hypothetical protein
VSGFGNTNCNDCQIGRAISFSLEYAQSSGRSDGWLGVNVNALTKVHGLKAGSLYQCASCESWWYLDPQGLMMNSVETERLPLILSWSEQTLVLSDETISVLRAIGVTPSDHYGNGSQYQTYPCAVRTFAGDFFPIAVVSKQRHAPFEIHRAYKLSCEIASIEPSEYALPVAVRQATSKAYEIRMGFAPTILETDMGIRLTANWTTNFLKMEGVDSTTTRIAEDQNYFSDTPPIIEELKPIYFAADL